MKSINKKLLLFGKIFLFIIVLELLREFPFILFGGWPTDGTPYNSQGVNISRGFNLLGTINRAQQAYHYENEEFASGINELETKIGIEINIDSDTLLSIESSKNYVSSEIKTRTIDIAALNYRNAPLFYYIFSKNFMTKEPVKYTLSSLVFFSEENKYQTIFCASKALGWQKLNKPYLQDGEPVCGEGTEKYE